MRRKFASYIAVAFQEWLANVELHQFYILAGEFAKTVDWKAHPYTTVTFEFQHTEYSMVSISGWSTSLWIVSYGSTDDECQTEWQTCLNMFVDFAMSIQPK